MQDFIHEQNLNRFIHEQNLKHFRLLLAGDLESEKREVIQGLLDDEEKRIPPKKADDD